MFAIVHLLESLHVFEYEYFGSMMLNVLQNIVEDGASSLGILESLLLSCLAEWLTWKTSDV